MEAAGDAIPPRFRFGQDALVCDILFEGRTGVIVDVGARDGVRISNAHDLARDLGWTEIAIEPHPDLFDRPRSSRGCECLNTAASDRSRADTEFVRFFEEKLGNSGLLSTFIRPDRLGSIEHEIIPVQTRAPTTSSATAAAFRPSPLLERFPTRWHHLVGEKAPQLKDLSIVFPLGPMRSERAMLKSLP